MCCASIKRGSKYLVLGGVDVSSLSGAGVLKNPKPQTLNTWNVQVKFVKGATREKDYLFIVFQELLLRNTVNEIIKSASRLPPPLISICLKTET